MSTSTATANGSIPDLVSRYSGVPARLAQEAIDAKSRLYSQKTLPDSVSRRRTTLPPGVSREAFDRAVTELRQSLGHENVDLNDKPLVDGWYMEHPYDGPGSTNDLDGG